MTLRPLPALLLALPLLLAAPAWAQVPDGPITRAQVQAALRRRFAAMDANHDGAISPAEFQAFRARTAAAPAGDPFGHVGGHWFEHADADGNGRVTPAEAAARPMRLFDMADVNHDGVVSPTERQMATALMSLGGK